MEGVGHRQTCSLSLDESEERFTEKEKEGHSGSGNTVSPGVELRQCHSVGSSRPAGLWHVGQAVGNGR